MAQKVRLTMAQALVRYLGAQFGENEGHSYPLFKGIFALFGHGNVTGLGEALENAGGLLPVFRAHNEQSMAHAAIAYAKAKRRLQMMACTTSVPIKPLAKNKTKRAINLSIHGLWGIHIIVSVHLTASPKPRDVYSLKNHTGTGVIQFSRVHIFTTSTRSQYRLSHLAKRDRPLGCLRRYHSSHA